MKSRFVSEKCRNALRLYGNDSAVRIVVFQNIFCNSLKRSAGTDSGNVNVDFFAELEVPSLDYDSIVKVIQDAYPEYEQVELMSYTRK